MGRVLRAIIAGRSERLLRLCLTGAVLLALLGGCPPPAPQEIRVTVTEPGQPTEELSQEEVTALARREGEMWWYTSLPRRQASEFLKRFEARYPFLTTHLVRGSTFDIVRRVDREIAQGQVQADALHVLDPAVFVDLRRRGELYVYDSPEARFIPPEHQDSGLWTAMRAVTICIAFDTRRMAESEVPHNWPELLEPRWRGKVGLKDAETGGSAYAQYYFLREEYGASYWRTMAGQSPRLFKSAADTLRALLSGEIELAGGILGYRVYQASEQEGQPVRALWPDDGVPMIIGPLAILSRAPHPHAAMLFVDFSLSREGQQAIGELMGGYSVRGDVEPPRGRPKLSELNVLSQEGTWEEYRTRQDRLQTAYSRLFHPESE